MSKIACITPELPSFRPPLGRAAGLLRALHQAHHITLFYFASGADNPADLEAAMRLCQRVVRLEQPAGKGLMGRFRRDGDTTRRLTQELGHDPPRTVLLEGEARAPLVRAALSSLPGVRLLILHRNTIEVDGGPTLLFGPGIDTEYFRRQTPVNITAKQFLFSIQVDDKRDGLICREALHYLLKEVWPLVLQRHPEAILKVASASDPASFWDGPRQGEGWSLEYGTIIPAQYEAGRIALFSYRNIVPGNLQPCLEAWAMQLPLLTLPAAADALEKLGGKLGDNFLKGEDGPSLAALMGRLLEIRRPGLHLAEASRQLVETRFSWPALAVQLENFTGMERR